MRPHSPGKYMHMNQFQDQLEFFYRYLKEEPLFWGSGFMYLVNHIMQVCASSTFSEYCLCFGKAHHCPIFYTKWAWQLLMFTSKMSGWLSPPLFPLVCLILPAGIQPHVLALALTGIATSWLSLKPELFSSTG